MKNAIKWRTVQGLGAGMIMLGSMGLAVGASAQEKKSEEQRIVIMETKDGPAPDAKMRDFRIMHGEKGEIRLPEHCEHGQPAANIDDKDGDKRTRIFICAKAGGTPAEQVARLEKARDRIVQQGDLSAEARERIRVKLDEAIAKARAAQK